MTVADSPALTKLIHCHGAGLVLYARQWCSDPDDAVQEAFVELSKQRNPPADPIAWLYTTTKRRAINQLRGDRRRRQRNTRFNEQSATAAAWFESELETREEIEKLQSQLEQLEPQEREIVVTHIWGGLSFTQIAEVVLLSSSTVHRRYQSALSKLRLAWHESSAAETTNSQSLPTSAPPATRHDPPANQSSNDLSRPMLFFRNLP